MAPNPSEYQRASARSYSLGLYSKGYRMSQDIADGGPLMLEIFIKNKDEQIEKFGIGLAKDICRLYVEVGGNLSNPTDETLFKEVVRRYSPNLIDYRTDGGMRAIFNTDSLSAPLDSFIDYWFKGTGEYDSIYKEAVNLKIGLGPHLWHITMAIGEILLSYNPKKNKVNWLYCIRPSLHWWSGTQTVFWWQDKYTHGRENYDYSEYGNNYLGLTRDLRKLREVVSRYIKNPGKEFVKEQSSQASLLVRELSKTIPWDKTKGIFENNLTREYLKRSGLSKEFIEKWSQKAYLHWSGYSKFRSESGDFGYRQIMDIIECRYREKTDGGNLWLTYDYGVGYGDKALQELVKIICRDII